MQNLPFDFSSILRSLRRWLGSAAILCAMAALTGALRAADDREATTPAGWWWLRGASVTDIQKKRSAGYRLINLEVEQASPLRFTAAFVKNTGAYAKTSTWYYGTPGFVASKLSAFQGRLIDLEPYVAGNKLYLAGVMVKNTGSEWKNARWYYNQSIGSITTHLNALKGRLVDWDTYVLSGKRYYTAVMIPNTGKDSRAWSWYANATASSIKSLLATNKARLYDIERVTSSTYNVIMLRAPGKWWYYYGKTEAQVNDLVCRNGARLVDIDSYKPLFGARRFNVIMVNNSNALTTRIGEILRGTNGDVGCYLKRVNGPVLASLCSTKSFEPASTIKTLIHVHAMHRVHLGSIKLTDNIKSYQGSRTACPTTSAPWKNETLMTVLGAMMKNSDNYRTMSAELRFGRANINATATALGMTGTSINHRIGCGGPVANRLTLADIGRLHEKVVNGYLGTLKTAFYNLMYSKVGGYNSLIDQEAAALGLPASKVSLFKSKFSRAVKGGSYDLSGPRYYRSGFGTVWIPFCVGNVIVPRQYVYGTFVAGATDKTKANTAKSTASLEILRNEIRAALTTWKNAKVTGFSIPFGAGCKGTNGIVNHFTTGTPEIGKLQNFALKNGPKSSVAILDLGFSNTQWGPFRLPLDLTPFGATGCKLYTEPTIALAFATTSIGTRTVGLVHPNNKAFLGVRFFTQFVCVDLAANKLGLTYSNGVRTKLGGWPK